MKHAPRMWFYKLNNALKTIGFKQTKTNYALFVKEEQGSKTFILAYVDDLLITGNDIDKINKTKRDLTKFFNIKDLGRLKYFLRL